MLKEIHEQTVSLDQALEGRLGKASLLAECFGVQALEQFEAAQHVRLIACGTSFHAGLVASYWLESLAKISARAEIASEFRYRNDVVPEKGLLVTISQSGETADTLAALRKAKEKYHASLAICNVPESSLVRESSLVFMTRAGAEIGVASTKALLRNS